MNKDLDLTKILKDCPKEVSLIINGVRFMYKNHVAFALVRGYQVILGKGEYYGEFLNGNEISRINYLVRTDDNKIKDIKSESELFPTKEELLKSL